MNLLYRVLHISASVKWKLPGGRGEYGRLFGLAAALPLRHVLLLLQADGVLQYIFIGYFMLA